MEANDTALENDKPMNKVRIVDIPITDENSALNVMVSFLGLAQKRGVFTIDDLNLLAAFSQITVLGLVSAEGHKKIDLLNNELKGKIVKIAEYK